LDAEGKKNRNLDREGEGKERETKSGRAAFQTQAISRDEVFGGLG